MIISSCKLHVLHVHVLDTKNHTVMFLVLTFSKFKRYGTTRGHSDAAYCSTQEPLGTTF